MKRARLTCSKVLTVTHAGARPPRGTRAPAGHDSDPLR
eukprot:COSAG02_NODE_43922_length_370_cov_1.011070_1_plen_37_part_01